MGLNLMQGAVTALILQPRKLPKEKVLAAAALSSMMTGAPGMLLPLLLVTNGRTAPQPPQLGNGLAQTVVPKVEGLSEEDATRTLRAAGLGADVIYDKDPHLGSKVVYSQDPEGGEVVDIDTVVELLVEADQAPSTTALVPDLEGDGKADALRHLERLGLNGVVQEVNVSGKDGDVVIKQSPKAGKRAGKDKKVTLFVQKPDEAATGATRALGA